MIMIVYKCDFLPSSYLRLQRHHGEAVAPEVEQARREQTVGGQGGGREGEEEEDQQVNEAVVVVECLIDIVIERSITTISN